jgi:nucleotide-binding universal stress UspA family protein
MTKSGIMAFKNILVAVDDGGHAMRVAETAFKLAHSLAGRIGIIYVVDRTREVVSADLGITAEQSGIALLAEAERTIDQLIRDYPNPERVVRFTPEGSPEKEILHIATEWGADLIIIGSNERSGLEKLLSGSVTNYVIRHSAIPVVVVPGVRP